MPLPVFKGTSISLLSHHLIWPHFILTECTAIGCSYDKLGHKQWIDPVCHSCNQSQCIKFRQNAGRWNEMRWSETRRVIQPFFMSKLRSASWHSDHEGSPTCDRMPFLKPTYDTLTFFIHSSTARGKMLLFVHRLSNSSNHTHKLLY